MVPLLNGSSPGAGIVHSQRMTKQRFGVVLGSMLALAVSATTWAKDAPHATKKAATAQTPASSVTSYSVALPVAASLVAWLPVAGHADEVDLDLRVEVVLPHGCGDRLAGLLVRDAGATHDGAGYEVVIARPAGVVCAKEAKRVSARTAVRLKLAAGTTRALRLGQLRLQVARAAARSAAGVEGVTLDGAGPTGDVPGAPPTARPQVLVLGAVRGVKMAGTETVAGEAHAVAATLDVRASWPRCAEAPLGFLGSGDASTGFAITHFQPIAVQPQDEPCTSTAIRTTRLLALVRLDGAATQITVDGVKLDVPAQPATR